MKIGILILSLIGLSSVSYAETRTISVGAYAEKSVEPNLINVSVEIWSKAATAKGAQQAVASEFQKVKKSIEAFKVKKEDFSSENYSLNQDLVYDQKTQQNKLVGFKVSQTLNVVIRKTEDIGNFLDAVSSSSKNLDRGVNINSIQWDSDKKAQTEISALSEAVQNARKKAEEMARAEGLKIKSVLHMANAAEIQRPIPARREYFTKALAADAAGTELPAGQIKVRVDVQAEYEIN